MEKSIYEYDDYKKYLKEWIRAQPHHGRGQLSRIAKVLGISSVSVSYVFNDQRNFSEEQAVELNEFLGLSEAEADYFLLLIQFARAGSKKLEQRYLQQIRATRAKALDVKERVPRHQEMNESAKAMFYSNWYFSAARLLTSIPGYQDIDALSARLQMPRAKVHEVVDFLLQYGLSVQKNRRLSMGPARTHIEAKSPLAAAHHRNWRLKAIERMSARRDDDLFFTGPMTLSEKTFGEIRKDLVDLIGAATKAIEPSKSEVLGCLNLDLFQL